MHQIQMVQMTNSACTIISPYKRTQSGKERKSHTTAKFALVSQLNGEITAVICEIAIRNGIVRATINN